MYRIYIDSQFGYQKNKQFKNIYKIYYISIILYFFIKIVHI